MYIPLLFTYSFMNLRLGFAFGFFEGDMRWAGTSDTTECSLDPKFTEYLHAVILSSLIPLLIYNLYSFYII